MNASLFAPDLRDFIFYGRDPENAACLYGALADFWGGRVPHVEAPGSLLNPGVFFQFGLPPNRIDLISTMGTVNFNEAWERRITVPFEGDGWVSALHVVSLEDLIQAKRDAWRLQDLADIDALTRPI